MPWAPSPYLVSVAPAGVTRYRSNDETVVDAHDAHDAVTTWAEGRRDSGIFDLLVVDLAGRRQFRYRGVRIERSEVTVYFPGDRR